MKKYIYATKNKKSSNFNAPLLHDFPKDAAAEAFKISALETGGAHVKELEVYCLGTYDTSTGIITSEVTFIIDLGGVLDERVEANS